MNKTGIFGGKILNSHRCCIRIYGVFNLEHVFVTWPSVETACVHFHFVFEILAKTLNTELKIVNNNDYM